MSKIKLDDRIENAVNAFFEADSDRSNFALTYTDHEAALAVDKPAFTEKADKWSNILRQIILFGPGAFLLYYMTLSLIFFYPQIGLVQGFFMLLIPAFITYAGLGDVRNTKNLVVPGSIIAMAVLFAIISTFFPAEAQPNLYFWYSIYLFPAVLIVAKLAQGLFSDKK